MRLLEGTIFDRPPRCERCDRLESECTCPPLKPEAMKIPPEKQTAHLAVEKRRKGKMVTVIRGLPARGNDLPDLLTRLKNACGAGGTLAEDELEIQGEHIPRIRTLLEGLGYRVKG